MRGSRWTALAAVVVAGLTGCAEPPDERPPTEAELVAQAREAFDPFDYDTVKWSSEEEALARGGDIFKWACAECHGAEGRGDGGRVIDGDTLRPPSMLKERWAYAEDPHALQARIFTGNELGMPHWGLRQMRPRDIVAVERYIRYELRKGISNGS